MSTENNLTLPSVHDDKIYDEIREHLARAEEPLRSVHVDVEGGVVTLRGSVETPAEQQLALELARGAHGVHEVRDRLRVASSLLEQLKNAISYVL
ncbi:MAG TPA: BON domain-containing protein [Polyangiaceae bacterium]|nr:BON domain-containing protein [Polyangiaceae bacterium]